jgi:hypothetical protein
MGELAQRRDPTRWQGDRGKEGEGMTRAILLSMLLAATAQAEFGVDLRLDPIPPIPMSQPDPQTTAERLAWMADHQAMWEHIRDTQVEWVWFAGVMRPCDGDSFYWPDSLTIRLGESAAMEVIASQGRVDGSMPLIHVWPGGQPMWFTDIETEWPSGKKCAIYVAFPRGEHPKIRERVEVIPCPSE